MQTSVDKQPGGGWAKTIIHRNEYSPYLVDGQDFIDDERIQRQLEAARSPEKTRVYDILAKARSLQRLEPSETAVLLNVTDAEVWEDMYLAAGEIKNAVYGPRVVTFAPLYCSNRCINSCLYCGFRCENREMTRRVLSLDEVREETASLVSRGHKRLVVVYGEHRKTDTDYIADTIRTIYDVKIGPGEIRRVNINAAPQSIDGFRTLRDVGIGTYQVFQETYHHETYQRVHPRGPKSDYKWRLYALHRAQEAGVDDVAIGALFGLYDWKFEVMGLLYHAIELEKTFGGIGPHTISFPRLEPAANAPLSVDQTGHRVSDRDFIRLITVLRLSVPYTGMIVTARESQAIRHRALEVGCTQTDASTRINLAGYSHDADVQEVDKQQFTLGDTRSLDEVVRELAAMGLLTSFCTAGYRCGRTGKCFMDIARTGRVHEFCIPNAILTCKEFLLDYASFETQRLGDALIEKHLASMPPRMKAVVAARLEEIVNGARDLRF